MVAKSLCQLESQAAYIVVQAVMLVVFWYGMWVLLDEGSTWLQERYGFTATHIGVGSLAIVLVFLYLSPTALSNF